MKKVFFNMIRSLTRRVGFDIIRYYPPDLSELNIEIYKTVKPYTVTSIERVNTLINAVKYIVKNDISGAMVECGVWKGGSAMAIALTLNKLGIRDREIYLYDTFSGMSAPSDIDVSITGSKALKNFSKTKISEDSSKWCFSSLDSVKEAIFSTNYPEDKIHFIKGKVEETIPSYTPKEIALLRLDTDWYESTKHELSYLFPLLQQNGVLIIDDYGHWEGAKKAVDEYISNNNIKIMLNRIDYTGRIAIKT